MSTSSYSKQEIPRDTPAFIRRIETRWISVLNSFLISICMLIACWWFSSTSRKQDSNHDQLIEVKTKLDVLLKANEHAVDKQVFDVEIANLKIRVAALEFEVTKSRKP